jgi:glycosyltransferase involved in cell wall biosynthesis
VVKEGETGILVAPGDPGTLADRLVRLLDEPEEARRLGTQGQAVVGRSRSAEVMGRDLDALYHRLAGEKGLLSGSALSVDP